MHLGSSPERVLKAHSSDQIAHLFAHPWSTAERTGLPSPVGGKAHSMPTHHSLGPDDGYGVKNARTATIEPNEQGSVSPSQIQSAWRALPQDIELMPQYQHFRLQPPSRLEAVAQHADEKEGNCDHPPDHVLIRSRPLLRRMKFSEATGVAAHLRLQAIPWLDQQSRS